MTYARYIEALVCLAAFGFASLIFFASDMAFEAHHETRLERMEQE